MKYVSRLSIFLVFMISFWTLQGCQIFTQPKGESIVSEAKSVGFKSIIIPTKAFKLFALSKAFQQGKPLVIYLEGDGHSMASKYRLSKDPTPHHPLALKLAVLDPRPNVIYLARPCQYIRQEDSQCHPKYWSSHRFSLEVIESTKEAINFLRQHFNTQAVHLIGFSGGGGLAVLVAAQEPAVKSVITLAGDLNLSLMQSIHQTSTLWGSRDPFDVAQTIRTIPQMHFSGEYDKTVPPKVAQSFVLKANSPCVNQKILPRFTHHQGWAQSWHELINVPVTCL